MVRFVNVDAKLRQACDALEPCIDCEIGIGLGGSFTENVVQLAIDLRKRAGPLGEQLVLTVGSADLRFRMIFCVFEMMTLKAEPSWAPIVEAVSSRKWNFRFVRRKLAYSGGMTSDKSKVWISFKD